MRSRNQNRRDYIVTINGNTEIVKNCHTRGAAVYRASKAIGIPMPKFSLKLGTWLSTIIDIIKV